MTVYEWLNSKGDITVNLNRYVACDCIDVLEIKMDIRREYSIDNGDHTLTRFPITVMRTLYNSQIPRNDLDMIVILGQMYKDATDFYNRNKN